MNAVRPGPLVVSGFMKTALGIGSGGRSTARSLTDYGLPVFIHDIEMILDLPVDRTVEPPGPPGGVWIAHCNPPELLRLLAAFKADALEGRYRIGIWAWELPRLPKHWARAASHLNEIWAPSRFVAAAVSDAIGQSSDAPIVRVVPHPLPSIRDVLPARTRFGASADAVVVLVMFDMRSSRARKNPDAAVEAFLRAFPRPRVDRLFLCKVLGGSASLIDLAALEARVAGRADMVLMTEPLSEPDTLSLIASADIVLSTHRAEGYGLVLAEAMALGRCVVATGWSGNIDFMTPDNSVLLPYHLTSTTDPQHIYPRGQVWAEVDIDAAAEWLRILADDSNLRVKLGTRARADIERHTAGFASAIADAPWLCKVQDGGSINDASCSR